MLNTWIDRYCAVLRVVMNACLAVMVVLVFGNVVLRYGFNSGIAISEELSRWLFLWVIFLGATVAVRERAHMGVDMLLMRLPLPLQRACLALGHVLMLWVTWLMFSGSLAQTRINWTVEAPVSGWSQAWAYGGGVVFAVSTGVMLLMDLWRVLTGELGLELSSAEGGANTDAQR